MTAAEYEEWVAFYRLEPFGEERAEIRSAWQLYVIGKFLGAKDLELEDLMMKFDSEGEGHERGIPQSQWTQEMWARWVNMYFGMLQKALG